MALKAKVEEKIGERVIAAGELRQGKKPSMLVSDEDNRNYRVNLRGDVAAAWPRGEVRLSGDEETDELIRLLSG